MLISSNSILLSSNNRFAETHDGHHDVEYILTIIDDNGDGKLDLEEVTNNYWLIIRELVKFNEEYSPGHKQKQDIDDKTWKSVYMRLETQMLKEREFRIKK